MMARKRLTPDLESQLLDERADPLDREYALRCMRYDGVRLHEGLVISLAEHLSPLLRARALEVLLAWDVPGWFEAVLERLVRDPSPIVRRRLAFALGATTLGRSERTERVVRALIDRIEHDGDDRVALIAYEAAHLVLVPETGWLTLNPEWFDRRRDVDWLLLAPYRDARELP
jgi:hypothetical protein